MNTQVLSSQDVQTSWQRFTMPFTATATTAPIMFTAMNGPDFTHLTNVQITLRPPPAIPAVPELPAPLMLSAGLLVPLLGRRFRRGAVARAV